MGSRGCGRRRSSRRIDVNLHAVLCHDAKCTLALSSSGDKGLGTIAWDIGRRHDMRDDANVGLQRDRRLDNAILDGGGLNQFSRRVDDAAGRGLLRAVAAFEASKGIERPLRVRFCIELPETDSARESGSFRSPAPAACR